MAKRKLAPVERIVVKADRELEEKAQHPDKIPIVQVADETDEAGNPRVFVVLREGPKSGPK